MITLSIIAACLTLGADSGLIAAIIEQESSGDIAALNVNRWQGEPVAYTDIESSVIGAELFVSHGYTVDIGLMGINSENIKRFDQTIEATFEPCTNIRTGERILVENLDAARRAGHHGDQATRVALSLYNTGSMTRGFKNGYVDSVWQRYRRQRRYLARTSSLSVPWQRDTKWFDRMTAPRKPWVIRQ